MRKTRERLSSNLQKCLFPVDRESGQAMVEYILMLAVAISLVAVMSKGFTKGLTSLWGFYIRKVSSACPTGCPPNTSYRFR